MFLTENFSRKFCSCSGIGACLINCFGGARKSKEICYVAGFNIFVHTVTVNIVLNSYRRQYSICILKWSSHPWLIFWIPQPATILIWWPIIRFNMHSTLSSDKAYISPCISSHIFIFSVYNISITWSNFIEIINSGWTMWHFWPLILIWWLILECRN